MLKSYFAAALLILVLLPISRAADSWQVGLAKQIITPEKPMWMAGYGARNKPAEGKLTELWAKAVVLEDAKGVRALAITLDLVGIDRDLSQAICEKIEKQHGLKREQIALFCSHTHSGPVVGKNLRAMHEFLLPAEQRELIAAYSRTLEGQIVDLAGAALKDLQPTKLTWQHTKCTFAVNRRANKEADVPQLQAEGKIQGPHDHDFPVLMIRSTNDELRGVLFGYACHATVLSGYEWCGDWPGYAQLEIEKRHPGCLALFWAGCGADQNPLPRRKVELAEKYGAQAADAVDAALTRVPEVIAPELKLTYREINVPLGALPSKEELEEAAKGKDKFVAARAQMLLADLAAGKPLAKDYPYPVAVWKLGREVTWVMLGGEVVVDYALRLKSDLAKPMTGGQHVWVAGYANDVMAYIPSRRVLIEGGYEGGGAMVYYGLPASWAPEVEEVIVAEVKKQAK
ncbi:neutral/alkaline non-lysosomal ceramidase N-terminal domain-containing protein [Anatilimnocola floriformis]|uniref:neutral/alkaline non-lysosomal ceramidase N-terminal domain-containing protein n=1 Tax=Anatilimnocola floriformis TaxID=2948575 RepID=UPI0020C233F6|nr:neutral/alkaline non-lysosomal ceramidase N-terminal domain-containing protein [Anatilimnocola floriformis]